MLDDIKTNVLLQHILDELKKLNQKQNFIISNHISYKDIKDEIKTQQEAAEEEKQVDSELADTIEKIVAYEAKGSSDEL